MPAVFAATKKYKVSFTGSCFSAACVSDGFLFPAGFACNGAWDVHIQKVRDNCKKKVNQLHSVIR